jgi:hypothetical protein
MTSEGEGEPNDATTDGELVAFFSPAERSVFIFAFVILVASIAGASIFFSLENAGKKDALKQSGKEPLSRTAPTTPTEPAPTRQSE